MNLTFIVPIVATFVDGLIFGILLGMSVRLWLFAIGLHIVATALWMHANVVNINVQRLLKYLTDLGQLLGTSNIYAMDIGALLLMLVFIVGAVVGYVIGVKLRIRTVLKEIIKHAGRREVRV